MSVCSDCCEFYSVPSRTPKVCRECESKAIARAAKEVDSKAMSIASLAAWLQSGQRPQQLERVWEIR